MYLKSIEIQGFKSFANKIHFEFHNGITAIVGPNGSGKSNVADAVRWVLGEQKVKQLRGASMQDVIFAGTELRKSLSSAFVAITLDNSNHELAIDFNEVTVSRRLYRSGESEYKLNGTTCRLKDIHELFYDTGIGKEGYSIIGQGQIEQILNGRPEDRRELFDEAAGIVKFKRRKYASIKKLDEEKANLVRVSDLLTELERQVTPLEKQAEKAKIYLQKRDSLRELECMAFGVEHTRINSEITKSLEVLKIAQDNLAEYNLKFDQVRKDYELTEGLIENLEEQLKNQRESITILVEDIQKEDTNIAILKEQVAASKLNEQQFIDRQEEFIEAISDKKKELGLLEIKKNELSQSFDEANSIKLKQEDKLKNINEKIKLLNDEISKHNHLLEEKLKEKASIASRFERIDGVIEQKNIQKATLQSSLLTMEKEQIVGNQQVEDLAKEFEDICKELMTIKEVESGIIQKNLQIKQALTGKDAKIRSLNEEYHKDKSKMEALINITERYEGYGNSVKRVMELKNNNKGIIGVVADIIKTKTQYETAIEVALGGDIQNIVTTDEFVAKKMIEFLKSERAGRATFLPLTNLNNIKEFKNDDCLKEKGVLGLAHTLVTVDDKYKNVAKAMLGRIVVVENVDYALNIAKKYRFSVRMVTLDGELLVPGGAMSGGAFKNNSNLLGRRREIDTLKSNLEATKDSLKLLEKEISDLKRDRDFTRNEMEKITAKIQDTTIIQNTKRLHLIAAEDNVQKAKDGALSLAEQFKNIENDIISQAKDKKILETEITEIEAYEIEIKNKLQKFSETFEALKDDEQVCNDEFHKYNVLLSGHKQEMDFHNQNMNRIEEDILKLTKDRENLSLFMQESKDSINSKNNEILELDKLAKVKAAKKGKLIQEIEANEIHKEELSSKQKTFFDTRETLSNELNNLDKEIYRLDAKKEKFINELDSYIQYMFDEYEITVTQAKEMIISDEISISEIKSNITQVKNEMRSLGNVNVNAIEEYKEVSERYNFLKKQHDDLIEAEKLLIKIIEQLDASMKKQFKENFTQIKTQFDKVFKELFGGGQGTLELLEGEDILEAGIAINAQPPGKKLQNMLQLSGGEKALTAIALLFAIQNLKPSPFCLLDEIEAALDESNVGRYAKYLHKLTTTTQFIVITHRRGTMEEADRLYGITMQEKGVSALVGVNLVTTDLS